jgi:hypothetical protein
VEQVRALVRESTSDDNMAALVVAASERACTEQLAAVAGLGSLRLIRALCFLIATSGCCLLLLLCTPQVWSRM